MNPRIFGLGKTKRKRGKFPAFRSAPGFAADAYRIEFNDGTVETVSDLQLSPAGSGRCSKCAWWYRHFNPIRLTTLPERSVALSQYEVRDS